MNPDELLDTVSAPVGALIASIGRSVAEAQQQMDAQTIANFQAIYSGDNGDAALRVLRELGYRPTFYQFPEVTAEINIALTISCSASKSSGSARGLAGALKLYAAPVDAAYSNKYNYQVEASSKVTFRIVPVPPSPAAEQMKIAPALIGKTWADARRILEAALIEFTFRGGTTASDTAVIAGQTPAAGEVMTGGSAIELWI